MNDLTGQMEQLANLLKTVRGAIEPLARDHRLRQWQKVNYDKHIDLLAEYGFTPDLKKSCALARKTIKQILFELDKLENEYGDLALDVSRQAIQPRAALTRTSQITREAELLEKPLLELQDHCRQLFAADEHARRLLTLGGLLPAAKRATPGDKESLEQGLRFFLLVTRDTPEAKGKSLAGFLEQAVSLERRLQALEFEQLPPMAVNILDGLRHTGLLACDRIKDYLDDFRRRPPGEINTLIQFRQQLNTLRQGEVSLLIEQLPALATRYGNILLDLANRASGQRQLEILPAFLGKIKLLLSTLEQGLLAELRTQWTTPGSPINPERVAAEHAAEFFTGIKGAVLTFKMLLQSLSGRKAISSAELHALGVEVLSNCPSHAAGSELEQTKLRQFLEERLFDFSRPFPFDLLFDYLKKIITIYGGRLEQAIHGHSVHEQNTGSGGAEGSRETTLARLAAKLEIWSERY